MRDGEVVQRAVLALAERPQRVDQRGDPERPVPCEELEQRLAQRHGHERHRLAVVADDADAHGLLAERLAIVLAFADHRRGVVAPCGQERDEQPERRTGGAEDRAGDRRQDDRDARDQPDHQGVEERRARAGSPGRESWRPIRRHPPTLRDR